MPNAYCSPELLAQISALGLRAQRVVEGTMAGSHVSPYHGVSMEFADYREYAPGDDLKRLDWRVFARTRRHYVKRFQEETNLSAMLLLDASHSMAYRGANLSKYDYAATLAAALAMLLVGQHDSVGLSLVNSVAQTTLPPRAARSQLTDVIRLLSDTRPEGETTVVEALKQSAERLSRRGLVILISDLLAEPEAVFAALGALRHKGHEILIFQILDADELALPFSGRVAFEGYEGEGAVAAEPWAFRHAYRQAMQSFVDDLRRRSQELRSDYQLLRPDLDLGEALATYLHTRRRRFGAIG